MSRLQDAQEGGTSVGNAVQVHFDCFYGKVDVVSSRYSALLGKNEIVPEVQLHPSCEQALHA
jgi:hypothetical protein